MIDHDSIRDDLKSFGGIEELCEVTMTFIGWRKGERVTVCILDRGPERNDLGIRYSCEAVRQDGKTASGNPGATVAEAISGVHWRDLD